MGAKASKTDLCEGDAGRRINRKRSLNPLKRDHKTPSNEKSSQPTQLTHTVSNSTTEATESSHDLSTNALTVQSITTNTSQSTVVDGSNEDEDAISESATEASITITQQFAAHAPVEDPSLDVEAEPSTAPQTPTPVRLPEPPMLEKESPSKYGLRTSFTPSPDLTTIKRRHRSASGLELFKAAQDPARRFSPPNLTQSAISPLQDMTNQLCPASHPTSPLAEAHETHAIAAEPFKPTRNTNNDRIARAFPPFPSQLACWRDHDSFHISSQRWAPVECSVCRRDGDEAANEQFSTCRWCALRICGVCRENLVRDGTAGLLGRLEV